MRTLFIALALFSVTLASAQAAEHGSLGKHEHGHARLDIALDGNTLEIALESPALNILGFEHAARSAEDKAATTAARVALENPLTLFDLPAAAHCQAHKIELNSPLFGHAGQEQTAGTSQAHNDIEASYTLHCSRPEDLVSISFAPLFRQFPGTREIAVQLVSPSGQRGAELTPNAPTIDF